MRDWDASAILPILIEQRFSRGSLELLGSGRGVATWWGTEFDCASAIARSGRERMATADEVQSAIGQLERLIVG
jgi:hypothetical protein